MSNSYKHHPISKDKNSQFAKKLASHKVRKLYLTDNLANGNSYKKHFEKWNICDWKFTESLESYKKGRLEYAGHEFDGMTPEQIDKKITFEFNKYYRNK